MYEKEKTKKGDGSHGTNALWSGTNKNRDVSTGSITRPFVRSHHSLCSLPRSWESEFLMSQNDLFLSHSAVGQSQYDFRLLTNSITHPSVHRPLLPLPADSQVASHYGQEQPRIKTQVLGHLHVCSLVRSHCSLIRLIRTARFVLLASLTRSAALTHALACSLSSLPRSWESE